MVYKWNVTLPKLTGRKRRKAYLYLPEDYEKHPEKRYPVLYMFDGHNVFFDYDATYGKSWGMNDYMVRTKREMIIVAVECNHVGNGRLCEYSPFSHGESTLGKVDGRGRLYMEWLTGYLKPFIDKRVRTLPDRANTWIGGSSMGGLMALYGVTAFNQVFGRAACLSPSLWIDLEKVMAFLEKSKLDDDTVIYMDYGSEELVNHDRNLESLLKVTDYLLCRKVNLTFRIVPGGSHCEACWEKQIPIFMRCLGEVAD